MQRSLFALPLVAAVLIGAKQAPQAAPTLPILPPAEVVADPANRLTLDLSNGGRVVIQMRPDAAPAHVERIRTLAGRGFYNNVVFHRVIPGFMAQTGDPKGTGQGESELPDLKAEFNRLPHLRGSVSMARTDDPDSANSQFFIAFSPNVALDRKYTVFGRVIEGMAAVDSIEVGEPPAQPTRIVRATIGAAAAQAAAPAATATPVSAPVEEPAAPSGS